MAIRNLIVYTILSRTCIRQIFASLKFTIGFLKHILINLPNSMGITNLVRIL
jgi:hypothetical protein